MSRYERTLKAVFEDPVGANIRWADIEAMLESLGAQLSEGRGSRLRVALGGVKAVFHRPHPRKDAPKHTVRAVRRFLTEAGIQP